MRKSKKLFNLYISDENIGFVVSDDQSNELFNYGEIPLTEGTVLNGEIKEPELLVLKLKSALKDYKVKAKNTRFVIHEQNILLRRLMVDKKQLGTLTIEHYIEQEIGKSIHFPYDNPFFDAHIQYETDTAYALIILVVNKDLLEDYLDVFHKAKIRRVEFDLSFMALYRVFYKRNEIKQKEEDATTKEVQLEDGLMLVSLYDRQVSLVIFDKEYPVFGMIEELEGKINYCESIVHYIDRITNYYTYNMFKGQRKINRVELFSFASDTVENQIQFNMEKCMEKHPFHFFDIAKELDYLENKLPRGCYIPFAASLRK